MPDLEAPMRFEEIARTRDRDKTKIILRSEDGIFVKVHAIRRRLGFGELDFKFTGSHCGEDGKALRESGRIKVLREGMHHELQVAAHMAASSADIAAHFDEGARVVARMVVVAVLNEWAEQAAYQERQ